MAACTAGELNRTSYQLAIGVIMHAKRHTDIFQGRFN